MAAPTYIANLEILAHEEVEGGAGVCADGADAAAAVSQEPQAEVGAQLRVLLKQQLWELPPRGKTDAGQPLPMLGQKVSRGDGGRGACLGSAFSGQAQQAWESNLGEVLAVGPWVSDSATLILSCLLCQLWLRIVCLVELLDTQ